MLKTLFLPLLLFTLCITTSCKNDHTTFTNKITTLQAEINQLKTMSIDTKPGFVHTVYFYAAEGLTEQRKTDNFHQKSAAGILNPTVAKVSTSIVSTVSISFPDFSQASKPPAR